MADYRPLPKCPFCDAEAHLGEGEWGQGHPVHFVKCGDCGAEVEGETREAAIDAWARRPIIATLPGGAPDQETQDIMSRLSDLQGWCALMMRKDSGGIPASQLIQDVRAFIVERTYPNAIARRLTPPTTQKETLS